jgi:hypothetical protein
VGRRISEVGDRGTPGYRRDRQELFRPKSMDMVRIWKVFGLLITVGS